MELDRRKFMLVAGGILAAPFLPSPEVKGDGMLVCQPSEMPPPDMDQATFFVRRYFATKYPMDREGLGTLAFDPRAGEFKVMTSRGWIPVPQERLR